MSFSKQELKDCLNELGLSQTDLAKLLSVNIRTVNRWCNNPEEITGPAEQALRAWMRLKSNNLYWIPDEFEIGIELKKVIKRKISINSELDSIQTKERPKVNVILQDRNKFPGKKANKIVHSTVQVYSTDGKSIINMPSLCYSTEDEPIKKE